MGHDARDGLVLAICGTLQRQVPPCSIGYVVGPAYPKKRNHQQLALPQSGATNIGVGSNDASG